MACTFQATIDGKFAPLIGLRVEEMDIATMITTYNTAVTNAASEILWKERCRKKPWAAEMFSTSVIRGETSKRRGMKQKERKNTGKQTR